MTWAQLVTLAIATATAGTDADTNPIIKQRLEASAMTDQALQALATMVAGNVELRARLEKQFSVSLSGGVGAVPAGMLVEYLREGCVRDSDTGANNGLGNVLSRIQRYSTFIQDTDTAFGQYCVVDNQFYARPPASIYPSDTIGPLVIDAPFTPTVGDMNATVPDELSNDLVEMLAIRLKGIIAQPEAA